MMAQHIVCGAELLLNIALEYTVNKMEENTIWHISSPKNLFAKSQWWRGFGITLVLMAIWYIPVNLLCHLKNIIRPLNQFLLRDQSVSVQIDCLSLSSNLVFIKVAIMDGGERRQSKACLILMVCIKSHSSRLHPTVHECPQYEKLEERQPCHEKAQEKGGKY